MFVINAFGSLWDLDLSGLEEPLAVSLRALWSRAAVEVPGDAGHQTTDVLPFTVARMPDGSVSMADGAHRGSDDHLPYALSRALTVASIRRRAGHAVMLHAAGVALPDGSTAALVAASGTGKTTASRVLCQTLGYVSDETVAIDLDGRVRPWAKPLSVVIDPALRWEKHEHSPDELGLVRAPEELHLTAIILLTRDLDHEGSPLLERMGLVDALDTVLPQTSSLFQLQSPLSHLAGLLTAANGPWRLTYREAGECIDLVTEVARGARSAAGDPVTWSATQDDPLAEAKPPERVELSRRERAELVTGQSLLRRGPHRESVISDGQAIVLRQGATTLLPGLAAAMWEALDVPRPVSELTDLAQASLGQHPEAEALVLGALKDLVRTGLVLPMVQTPIRAAPSPH